MTDVQYQRGQVAHLLLKLKEKNEEIAQLTVSKDSILSELQKCQQQRDYYKNLYKKLWKGK